MSQKRFSSLALTSLFIVTLTIADMSVASSTENKGEMVIYSSRKEHLIKPLFDQYTKETGVKIRYVTDAEGPLIARMQAEGKATPADMFITVDAGNLWQAQQKGLLQPVQSEILNKNIPEHLRDPNNNWFGLSVRARTMVYATDRVKPEELSTYEDLASSKWDGRLCLRTAKKVYNQSLVGTLIARLGQEKTEVIVKGWVNNLATPVFSNDTLALQAVDAGQCDVTVVNTYYFGRLLKEKPNLKLKIFWANQSSSGTHVNISGAGITKYAKHKATAVAFLEWLSQPEAQKIFANVNMEFPANQSVKPSELVARWGEFKQDQLNVEAAGRLQGEAIKLMDRAGYH
ncbi:extracellular solute-binding protein [Zooshikella sp. RANM57]|uniref:extracellular solute-binding protein n=1 Tax=Zooshikella sp. RANM57 TaxID=3425863 RepID=UPI003D6E1D4D